MKLVAILNTNVQLGQDRMKKCVSCNSSRITINDDGEMFCQNCGYIHSNKKNPVMVTYGNEKNTI